MNWISVEIGVPAKFGTRVKIKRKSWDEEENLIFVESEATYDKDSDFSELSNRSYEYETWFDHELNKYLEEDELTHWMPLPAPPGNTKYDWSNVPNEVNWIATDSLGYGFGWINRPHHHSSGQSRWNDEDCYFRFALPPQFNPFKGDWKDSLEQRPGEPQ